MSTIHKVTETDRASAPPAAARPPSPVVQAAKRGMTPPPQETPKVRRLAPEAWSSDETNALKKLRPKLFKGAINPSEFVQINILVGENQFLPFPISKFILARLPYFQSKLSQGKDAQTGVIELQGSPESPFFHPQAAAQIVEQLQAQNQIFNETDCTTLKQLKEQFSAEFDVILDDIVHLSTLFQIKRLQEDCLKFLLEELEKGSDDDVMHYLEWSLNAHKNTVDLLKKVIGCFRNIDSRQIKIFKALEVLSEADFSTYSADQKKVKLKILKDYFRMILSLSPNNATTLIATFECLVKLFPHFDHPKEIFNIRLPKDIVPPDKTALFCSVANFCSSRRGVVVPPPPGTPAEGKLKEYSLLAEAMKDIHSGNLSPAASLRFHRLLEEVLALNPHNMRALLEKADLFYNNLGELDAALQVEPHYIPALLLRARSLYIQWKNFDAALKDYALCLEMDPENQEVLSARSLCHKTNGNYDAAIKDCTALLEINPGCVEALEIRAECHLLNRNPHAALADWNRRINLFLTDDDEDPLNAYLSRGNCHRMLGNLEAAIEDYTQCLKINDEDQSAAEAMAFRGECYRLQGNDVKALDDFEKSLADIFDLPHQLEAFILSRKGEFYRLKGKNEDALKDFQRCLLIDPADDAVKAFVFARMADCHLQVGDLEAASRDLKTCFELKPDQSNQAFAITRLGWFHLKKGDFETAIKYLNDSLVLVPNDLVTLIVRGEALLFKGERESALKDFSFCLAIASHPFLKGECHRLMGNTHAAISSYSECIRAESDHLAAIARRDECYRLNQKL